MKNSRFMMPGEVAEEFGVDAKTVARWAKAGKLPFVTTPGGHRRFDKEEIKNIVEELTSRRKS